MPLCRKRWQEKVFTIDLAGDDREADMPKIIFLPHEKLCPEGAVVEAESGENICAVALRNGIEIEHACELSCACTTCHVIVRRAVTPLSHLMSWKTICWTKRGVWSLIPA
jgi:ferredoxin